MKIRSAESTQIDLLSLGEVMLRLDPRDRRIRNARTFDAWEGGGEYNVARGLHTCFGLRSAVATALVNNEVGHLLENFIIQGGVETRFIQWMDFDGVGHASRNGLNFTERGFGLRGAIGEYDRGHTAASQLAPGDFDWDHIFGEIGVRWFHTGGIFASLSNSTSELVEEAMTAAKKYGVVVSYDSNYRPSLWRTNGGDEGAMKVNRKLAQYVDVIFDFSAALGIQVCGISSDLSQLNKEEFSQLIREAKKQYPNLQVMAATRRKVHSASRNDWGAIAWSEETGIVESPLRENVEIYDRVGGGDSFASGLIYGLMELGNLQTGVQYGAAHGALTMTTPGDVSMATLNQVVELANGGDARVKR